MVTYFIWILYLFICFKYCSWFTFQSKFNHTIL